MRVFKCYINAYTGVRVVCVSQVYLKVCSSALSFIGLHNTDAIKVCVKHVSRFEIVFSCDWSFPGFVFACACVYFVTKNNTL